MARIKNKRKYVKSGKYKKSKPNEVIKHTATHNEPIIEDTGVLPITEGIWFPEDFVKLQQTGKNICIFIEKGKLIDMDKVAKKL